MKLFLLLSIFVIFPQCRCKDVEDTVEKEVADLKHLPATPQVNFPFSECNDSSNCNTYSLNQLEDFVANGNNKMLENIEKSVDQLNEMPYVPAIDVPSSCKNNCTSDVFRSVQRYVNESMSSMMSMPREIWKGMTKLTKLASVPQIDRPFPEESAPNLMVMSNAAQGNMPQSAPTKPRNRFNLLASKFRRNDTCFKYLGCFSNSAPWFSFTRPIRTPEPPEKVSTTAVVYTRKVFNLTLNTFPVMSAKWRQVINPNLNTTILCHGFLSSAYEPWMGNLSLALLERYDQNVIIIDWSKGADGNYFDYLQAVGNTRVVSAVVTRLIVYLMEKNLASPERIHLIGHSLGAHIMAYVGKSFLGKIWWLTGLDPAGPLFTGHPNEVRMVDSDAQFTEGIHTNVGGEGVITSSGHCDFFVNIGFIQPECIIPSKDNPIAMSCAHQASHIFYTSSVKNQNCFLGRSISLTNIAIATANIATLGKVIERFNSTACLSSNSSCVPMGLEAIHYKNKCLQQKGQGIFSRNTEYDGSYVVYTEDDYPYCLNW